MNICNSHRFFEAIKHVNSGNINGLEFELPAIPEPLHAPLRAVAHHCLSLHLQNNNPNLDPELTSRHKRAIEARDLWVNRSIFRR